MGSKNQELTGTRQLGKKIAEVGAGGLALGIILGFLGISGSLSNVLTIGGLAVALVGLIMWKLRRGETDMSEGAVTLRDTQDADGVRRLTAALRGGDLVIEGWDHGEGVERVFGYREYEWVWTVKAEDVPRLREALGDPPDLTSALRGRFSGGAAAELGPFLDSRGIPYETWSRIGD